MNLCKERCIKRIHLIYLSENVDLTSSITGSRATTSMLDAPGLLNTMVDFLLLLGVSFTYIWLNVDDLQKGPKQIQSCVFHTIQAYFIKFYLPLLFCGQSCQPFCEYQQGCVAFEISKINTIFTIPSVILILSSCHNFMATKLS